MECLLDEATAKYCLCCSLALPTVIGYIRVILSDVHPGDVWRALVTSEERLLREPESEYRVLRGAKQGDATCEEDIAFVMRAPWPFWDRDVLQRRWMLPLPGSDEGVAIVMRSFEDERLFPKRPDRVRAFVHKCGYLLRPLAKRSGGPGLELTVCQQIDLGGLCPEWAQELLVRWAVSRGLQWAEELREHCNRQHSARADGEAEAEAASEPDVEAEAEAGAGPAPAPPCCGCGMESLRLDWAGAFGGRAEGGLGLPAAWGRLRQPGTGGEASRWLRGTRELLEVLAKLCGALLDGPAGAPPLLGSSDPQGASDADANAEHGAEARDTSWLLGCGLFGICASASCAQLRENKLAVVELFRRLLPQHSPDACNLEGCAVPSVLFALLQSNSFVSTLLSLGELGSLEQQSLPSFKKLHQQDAAERSQRKLRRTCHQWRLELLGVADAAPWKELSKASALTEHFDADDDDSPPLEPRASRPASLPPMAFRAVFDGAPRAAMAAVLASLITGAVARTARSSAAPQGASPTCCVQQIFALGMLAPLCLDELLSTLQGNTYLRLFEHYSQRNTRVASLCQLLLRGPLKVRVRALLPRILPAMVLAKQMQTIQDLCALLEESVQSLFTPQLPYILSAIAEQPVQHVAGSFMFILQRVYNNQMTITNICDASLGKVLVLILWSSARAGGGQEARSRALAAIENIVGALRAHQPGASGPGAPEPPRKRRVEATAVAAAATAPPRKRRPGASGGASAVPVLDEAPPPEVAQTLEASFLHVLDILEIVLTGNRQSPKWAEYSSLLQDPGGGDSLDHARLLAAVALLFELAPGSLHRFAPKILEFLQSAAALSEHQAQGVRCWEHFVRAAGVPRLRPLLPAVVGELLRVAERLGGQAPAGRQQLCKGLLGGILEATCREQPELAALLPALPPWPELRAAAAAVEAALGPLRERSFAERLEAGVAQLEGATQQAVRRAALEHIGDLVAVQRGVPSAGITELSTPQLARLVRALLKFLWESSAWLEDQLRCGQVLGAIGAVDPSRFSRLDLGEGRGARAPQDLGNTELLAQRVLAEFLVPNLTGKNSYAFAAQEILKYLRATGKAERILARLQEDVRETLRPYLHSSYQLIEPAQLLGDASSFEGVVAQAAALVQGEQRALFEACLPAVHGNHALALFLMHHVVHQLLSSSTALADLSRLAASLAGLLDSPKHSTAQAVFSLVDDMSQRREQLQLEPPVASRPGDAATRGRQLQRVEQLRRPITHRRVVAAAVRCGAHARALQFLEEAIIEEYQGDSVNPFDSPRIHSEDDCFLLQSIYRDLDEPDGVLGALRIGPATARTRTLQLEQAGRWHDVQACYEERLSALAGPGTGGREGPERQGLLCGLVRCTQNTRRFESSLRLIQGLGEEELRAGLKPFAVEAAWQLSSWERLQQALDMPAAREDNEDFQVRLGQALLAFHKQDRESLRSVLRETTLQVTRTLASAARESYTRAYHHLLKLHVLSDIAWLSSFREGSSASKALAQNLLARSEATAPTFPTRQLVLGPLRVVLMDMGLTDDAKRVELAFISLCRKHSVSITMEHPSISFSRVSPELLVRAQLEWGRLLYARGSRHDALQHMQQLALQHPKARLLGTRWATEASSELLIPRVAEAFFKEAKERLPEDEAAWFYHAAYLDQLLKEQLLAKGPTGTPGPTRPLRRSQSGASACPFDLRNLVTFTLRGYLQALHRGSKRLHFILNRVLQLTWDCCELDLHKKDALAEIDRQSKTMGPWMWYVVLPQLISRVHNPDMRLVFTRLIMSVLIAYPHQAGWQMVQLLKSSDKDHQKLGKDMLLEVGRSHNDVHRTMVMYYQVCTDLNTLATYNPPDGAATMSLEKSFPKLVGQIARPSDKWGVLVPLQAQMTAAIPVLRYQHKKSGTINPFPEMIITERCLETVDVFRTKERPKKLTFRGNDGKLYPFLCKAERRGDLRKDSRMMQFGVMVNQLLQKNPDARRRNLEVQTFNVVIFAESCGLIEWVSNTRGMRHIIDDLWKRLRPGHQQSVREIKDLFDHSKDLYETFTKQVLPRHPPVLHRWFTINADPSVWLFKRLTYSRSQALWCMLGYILGLGDRHGENILLDTESGRMVHVDFDCLFGKGMLLERPETVPFRLTQNCVAAMGVTGIEGVFRRSCELCMEVLRDRANQQTLLSVLHVFIADPLIEWTSRPHKDRHDEERGIQQARSTIGDVEKKLNGMLNVGAVVGPGAQHDGESVLSPEERGRGLLGRDRGVGLSVAGQVDELLKAAMCKRNLSEMYVGWQPWL
uniref:Serine/threonine-protein kinase ATR n=1 Tax=Lingulaulax polyedra TaxID=160621 RepID=A0A516AGC6_LINPO|nr:serine/threonine-protein kinase ATR [Lingulodinium polyedra]